ncbi:RidA family protein [Wenzhouxiangella marina]|uniref:Putative translation initiation inhibitor, yjgF family n=1 Tax=Wenzhouxiangella marina TaxID=1579979 RepID=A0A0K0XVV0_9GAMM|nr:Rid family hydrolase [Wenzhouxiangella marina]AKS41834.1 Putative translation initiation inhibitor, yjgF family [Wenzhouxiangella marina]MBB6086401.1 2-aminomuconate deaminase [Wenzhouxiangella marina]
MSDKIHSDTAPRPVGSYPHARRVGNLLFLSGLGPRIPGSDEVPGNVYDEAGTLIDYDIEAQTRQLVANLDQVLASAGASRANLVDITVFLTDMKRDFKRFNAIYAEYFTEAAPCRTTVEINALPTPIAIEFKCMAAFAE